MHDCETIRAEIDRIRAELVLDIDGPKAPQLRAANQALSWVVDPEIAAPPLSVIVDIQEGSAGCSECNRPL